MATERVKVRVMGVFMQQDETVAQHFVLFRDEAGRRLPIWVGQFEAWAIAFALEGETPERPFTHDAWLLSLKAVGAEIAEAYINDLRDDTFYSILALRIGDRVEHLDVRPSDAVAMALRGKCPIFIREDVMDQAHHRTKANEDPPEA